MAISYTYKARTATGQVITGEMLADNEAAVAAHIRGQGNYVASIKAGAGQESSFKKLQDGMTSVSDKDLALMCRQFGAMIEAGMSMVVALNVLVDQTGNKKLQAALKQVYKKVQEGESMSTAMAAHPDVFPILVVSMVEAGEVGGVLDVVLERLAFHYEKEYKMKGKVKSAMTYPAIVMLMAVGASLFVLTFIMPTFVTMFKQMKMELPFVTQMMMVASEFITGNWLMLLIGTIVAIPIIKIIAKRPAVSDYLDDVSLRLPVFGMLWRKVAISRFARTMATLIKGGVPLISALEVVKKTIGNTRIARVLASVQSGIREGVSMAVPLAASGEFTPMVIQMIVIGEEAGEMEKMLNKIADFYDDEVDDLIARLSALLEPIMITVLGVVVGGMVVAIFLPMIEISINAGGR